MEMKDTLSSCSNSEEQEMQQIQDKAKESRMTTEEKVDTSKVFDASLVNTESSGTESKEQDTNSRSRNDAHADDADIRLIYDEEPTAEVQTTTEINVFATGQQHKKAKVKHDIDVNETINIKLEHKVAKLLKENETWNRHHKELSDSIKTMRVKTIEYTTSLIANNDDIKAQLQEKGFAIAALKNKLRKLTGNSVNTKFAKSSILGKLILQPHTNQSVVRKPIVFKSERPRLSKPSKMEMKDTLSSCSNLEEQEMQQIQDKAKESRMKAVGHNQKSRIQTADQGMMHMLMMQISDSYMMKSQRLREAKVKHDIDVNETINIKLEHKVAKLLKENETWKRHHKELSDSIKTMRAKTIEYTTSLIANNDDFKAQLQEKRFAIAALKNKLRKLTGNSVNTKFAKSSILGKPILQPHTNQSVVRKPIVFKSERPRLSKPRFASQVDVNKDLSKPVTTHYLQKEREVSSIKPQHVIASRNFRYSSKNMLRFSLKNMVHNHYLEEAKNKTQDEGRKSKPSMMLSTRSQSTTNGSKLKPMINNQKSWNWLATKSSCVMTKTVPIAKQSKNSRNFSDSNILFAQHIRNVSLMEIMIIV
uniref:Uncharacterized protein n=1 Tax=Tanacetum cinerariifolium TaxID=118510 RepID=A0A6L2KVP6_TANCI|nr:hypothetical protein [Tanacetum cinerariifolium]